MSLANREADSPLIKQIVVAPTRNASQSSGQRKYVNILPRRPSDSTASSSQTPPVITEAKTKNQFPFRPSISFVGVFSSPVVEQPFELASLACSYQGQFPFLSVASTQPEQTAKRECSPIESGRLDASFNSLNAEEDARSYLNFILESEDIDTKKDNPSENKEQLKKKKEDVSSKSVELASKSTVEQRKCRDKGAATSSAEEAVRRSKRKINPPNFLAFAGDKKTDQEGKKEINNPDELHSNKSMSILGSSGKRVIRVGSFYQVNIPSAAQFVAATSASSLLEADRDECLWVSDPNSTNDPKVLEDYCSVARRHQKLQADEALEALYRNDYSVTETLNRLEEFHPRKPLADWSIEEAEVFNKQLSRVGKRFHLIAKQLPNKSLADVIEYYYKMKPTRCFLAFSSFMTCPFIESSNNLLDAPTTPRSECQNCVNDIGRNTAMKADNRGKKRVLPTCPACDLYSKLTKRYRPFTTPFEGKRKKCISPKKNEPSPENNNCQPANTHPHCFFVPRLVSLIKGVEWTGPEISACVKGFRKHGNNFKAIASELVGKDAYDVADFYTANQLSYRLDFMISLFERDSITAAAPLSRVKRQNKEAVDAGAKKIRSYYLDDLEEEDMDKSKDVVLKTKVRVLKSSVVTRNQRKQGHTAPPSTLIAPTCQVAPI